MNLIAAVAACFALFGVVPDSAPPALVIGKVPPSFGKRPRGRPIISLRRRRKALFLIESSRRANELAAARRLARQTRVQV